MVALGAGNANPWVGVVTGLVLAVVVAVMPVSSSKPHYPSSQRKKWGMVAVMLGIAAFFFAFTR
jgi:hypothetical protein